MQVSKVIVLDPGHGSTRGAPGYDPGVTNGDRHEASAALEMALTLKQLLQEDGWIVKLTHDGKQGGKPDLAGRVQFARDHNALVFLSVHFNSVRTYALVYYAPGETSFSLAKKVAKECGIPSDKVWPSSSSRFNGLYIDAFPDSRPSILWEVGPIDKAPKAGKLGKAKRIELCKPVVRALRGYL